VKKKVDIQCCPGTLAPGYDTYSVTTLRRLFDGRKVHHQLPYDSPNSTTDADDQYLHNRNRISISGVQEKFSLVLHKNKLSLAKDDDQATYILKPKPLYGKNLEHMPANEHLTMQIARQVYGIDTAENGLIFFQDASPAYITKRFDIKPDGSKWASEDFASLAQRTPSTHGDNFKYEGCYLDVFKTMQRYLPIYQVEAAKLFKVIVFNYLFSNGDAHYKNFSLIENTIGDFRLSPAYDLLNTRLHVDDSDFALSDGLLPRNVIKRQIRHQFLTLADMAGLRQTQIDRVMGVMMKQNDKIKNMIDSSFLPKKLQRNYWQAYQAKYKQLTK